MILTFLPNPSLDKVSIVSGFDRGGVSYAEQAQWYAGGKGFHFGRALSQLGETPLVIAPLGGSTGQFIAGLAAAESIPFEACWVSRSTRSGHVIIDERSRTITELYETGSTPLPHEWQSLENSLVKHLPQAQLLAVCGSFPPGAPQSALADLVDQSKEMNVPVLLDSYGPQLSSAMPRRPDGIKINQHEAGDLLGMTIATPDEALEAALRIQERGALAVVITLGAQGAVGVDPQGVEFGWSNPPVEGLYPVGSGDSFFAGLVYGLVNGESLEESARLGIAAGAANTLTTGPGAVDRDTVFRLVDQTRRSISI